ISFVRELISSAVAALVSRFFLGMGDTFPFPRRSQAQLYTEYRLTLYLSAISCALPSLVHNSMATCSFCSCDKCTKDRLLVQGRASSGRSCFIHSVNCCRVGYPSALTVLVLLRPCST